MASANIVRNLGIGVLGVILALIVWIGFATYLPSLEGRGHLFLFFVEYHLVIMIGMVLVALIFGFVLAQFFYLQLRRSQQTSSSIMDTVLLFLGREEREIIKFLVQRGGETTQAELSRLPGMTRVKAHRFLQKMQEKQLLDIIAHGKVRRVRLKMHVYATLQAPK